MLAQFNCKIDPFTISGSVPWTLLSPESRLFYVHFMFFWDRRSLQIRYAVSFFSMVLSMRSNVQMVLSIYIFFARHQHDTLSSLPPETRDVAARDSEDEDELHTYFDKLLSVFNSAKFY